MITTIVLSGYDEDAPGFVEWLNQTSGYIASIGSDKRNLVDGIDIDEDEGLLDLLSHLWTSYIRTHQK